MNALENRVRAAMRGTAEDIGPGSIPPLDLAGRERRRTAMQARADRHRARWARMIVPLVAAASVIAVIGVTALVIRSGDARTRHGHAAGHRHIARHHRIAGRRHSPAGVISLGTAPAYRAGAIPAYYVSLEPDTLSDLEPRAVVRATATGAALATIRPPAPDIAFTAVTAAADDRTFVLAAAELNEPDAALSPADYFVLRLDPDAGTARLTALHVPSTLIGQVSGMALAPDGTRLAIARRSETGTEQEIQVIDLATGSSRTWTGHSSKIRRIDGIVLNANPLSWTADGRTLAFEVQAPLPGAAATYQVQVRLLDTVAAGRALRSSRVAATVSGMISNAMITPDGARVVIPVVTPTTREYDEYSVRTGKLVAVLGVRHYPRADAGGFPRLLWVNSSGSTLIVSDAPPRGALLTANGEPTDGVLAVVTGSRFTPLRKGRDVPAW
jgi:hypothetical protein